MGEMAGGWIKGAGLLTPNGGTKAHSSEAPTLLIKPFTKLADKT
jgi:hypothetical protein